MPVRYIPLLRSKTGEAIALENLDARDKARLFPIIHIMASPPATFAARAGNAWAGLQMGLDGLFSFAATNSTSTFTNMFSGLVRAGAQMIPVVECDAPALYVTAVQRLVTRHAPGLVVKSSLRQLATVGAWVARQNWQRNTIDLIITAGHVADHDPELFEGLVTHSIQNNLPDPHGWRSVTLACSAAPRDHSFLPVGRTNVPRLDWRIWNAVFPRIPFRLDYGDYGIAYPDLTEPPGIAMARATVSVRYTVNDDWIILKGYPITGARGQPMERQYRGHARTLAGDPQFGGLRACWADQRIQQIAGGTVGAGNRPTWVSIGVNRHLSVVANRLP